MSRLDLPIPGRSGRNQGLEQSLGDHGHLLGGGRRAKLKSVFMFRYIAISPNGRSFRHPDRPTRVG